MSRIEEHNGSLETPRLVLRPFRAADAERASENSRQPRVAQWLPDMVLATAEAAAGWIQWLNQRMLKESPFLVLAVTVKPADLPVGFVAYAPKEELDGETEIVYQIADPLQGNGYATEAARALIEHGFASGDLEAIVGLAKPGNASSVRVLEKLAFLRQDTRILPYEGVPTEFFYYTLPKGGLT